MDEIKSQDEGLSPSVLDEILGQPEIKAEAQEVTQVQDSEETISPEVALTDVEPEDKVFNELPLPAQRRILKNERKWGRKIDEINARMEQMAQQNLQLQQILVNTLVPNSQNPQVSDVTTPTSPQVPASQDQFNQWYVQAKAAENISTRKQSLEQKLNNELAVIAQKDEEFGENMGAFLHAIGYTSNTHVTENPVTALAALQPKVGAEVMNRVAKTPQLRDEFSRMTPEEQASKFLELMNNYKSVQQNSQAPQPNNRLPNAPSPQKIDKSDPFDSYESTLAMMRKGMGWT